MESFKKYLKLLCCVFITLFMFGLGGEYVLAEPGTITVTAPGSTVQEQSWYFEWVPTGGYQNSLVKKDQEGHYVFCLDSNQKLYSGEMNQVSSLTGYQNGYQDKIAMILGNAYRLGLGNGDATHTIAGVTISEKDFYGVTQTAVWSAAHGENPAGGYTQKYKTWVESKGYTKIFDELMKEYHGYFDLTFDEKAQEADDTYYYSDTYVLTYGGVPDDVDIKISGPSISVGSGVQVKINNGSWQTLDLEHSYHLNSKDKFVTRALKPSTGSDSYRYSVSTGYYQGESNVYFYSSPDNYQNIVLGLPKDKSYTKVNNNRYDNVDINQKTIKIIKKNGSNYIGNATLELYIPQSSNDSVVSQSIATFISSSPTASDPTPSKSFTVDVGNRYCVREISAPYGYLLNDTSQCVDVTNESTEAQLTFTMQNEKLKVKFRKTDMEGNPIEGVKIKIVNYVENDLTHNTDGDYICAITDSQGYFTKPCTTGGTISDYYAGNGEFYLEPGDIKDRIGNMYYIQEEFKDGYYVRAFDPNDSLHATTQDFYLSDKVFFTEYSASNYIKLSGELGSEIVPTINILNDRYLKISKTDTGTGKEIKGAKMLLFDTSVLDTAVSENSISQLVDEWESDGTPHIFQGIIPGHEYSLTETVAPNGYSRLETEIKFKVDSDGKVELLTVDQHATVPEGYNYLIIGNDLKIDTPITGISLLNTIAIGGLMVFVGYEAIKIYRKRTA